MLRSRLVLELVLISVVILGNSFFGFVERQLDSSQADVDGESVNIEGSNIVRYQSEHI